MVLDKIMCPHCRKMNEMHKFCVFCGKQLISDDDKIKLIKDNPDPYCLNCGRPVKRDQTKCDCGYEFRDIKCPECGEKNPYTNRFCISCGKKLWRSDVYEYEYSERLFEHHLIFDETLPSELHNISLFERSLVGIAKYYPGDIGDRVGNNEEKLQSEDLKSDKNLCEIRSRWEVVSPHYCINCLSILKPEMVKPHKCTCPKCGSIYLGDKNRVDYLRSEENKYVEPVFDKTDLKWTSKYSGFYLGSLAPSIGESQFEYRERLKWEFAENIYRKKNIKNTIDYINRPKCINIDSNEQTGGEWEIYGITQDEWECQLMEESREFREKIEERIKNGETFL